ncbi:RNA polymerase sigma factor [Flavonifractor sp. HCP28S3_F3]|uniref:RNA polymerase sigma factor n=1 Tax=Flavonifractor sp. HCP28S3_F3 TaxID=3438939 RepID=UPI003F8C0BFF
MEEERKWIRDIQRRGSRQAADQLVRAYYDEIYRFAVRQTGHKEDAMDLTQTIFLAVLRSLPAFDGRKASFRTWLYRIAVNKAIDCRRMVREDVVPLEETEAPDRTDFAAQVQDRDLLNRLEDYVSGLDPETQAVYRLRVYGERTFPEIAAALGRPEAAVKTRYYRLMARLRKEFG